MGFQETSNLKYVGGFGLNSTPLAVILNSRQGKIPCGKDGWVRNTIKAAQYAAEHNWTVITSIGMNTWEMALWACSRTGGGQVIICRANSEGNYQDQIDEIVKDFNLAPERTGWLFYESAIKSRSPKSDWPKRDQLAIDTAKILIPVSVRTGGNLERLLNGSTGKEIITEFKTAYAAQSSERIAPPDIEIVGANVANLHWDHICHWTRTNNGPWPGQSRAAYYKGIAESDSYPNDGLATLINILHSKQIYGSSENIRENNKAVAFSNLPPKEMLPLMSWRKRRVSFNFEPYGIAISRQAAAAKEIRPVIYGPPSLYKRLSDSDKPYFQSDGENGGEWRPENEWRCLGDLDLSDIPDSEISIIVRDLSEIPKIRKCGNWQIESFCE